MSETSNSILVITYKFIEIQHYLRVKVTYTGSDVTAAYSNKICIRDGLPLHITWNYATHVGLKFYKYLNLKLCVHLYLTTAYL